MPNFSSVNLCWKSSRVCWNQNGYLELQLYIKSSTTGPLHVFYALALRHKFHFNKHVTRNIYGFMPQCWKRCWIILNAYGLCVLCTEVILLQKYLQSLYNCGFFVVSSTLKLLPSNLITILLFKVAQKARNSTRTSNRKEISAVNRAKMANHALKWEMDLYLFIRALFNEKLKRYNIEPHEIKSTRRWQKCYGWKTRLIQFCKYESKSIHLLHLSLQLFLCNPQACQAQYFVVSVILTNFKHLWKVL